MAEPVHIAAVDAGSNAIRLSIARAYSALDIEQLHAERYPLRLGEGVFLRHRFGEETLKKAGKAFRHFRALMDEFGVARYRAVATSASREAKNRGTLVRRIWKKAGLRLEVISGAEESRLCLEGVLGAVSPEAPPRCVVDLGGGSLEISLLREHVVEQSAQLPAGTVRLMTTLGIPGVIRPSQAEQVRRYVRALLESRLPTRPNLTDTIVVACGGNAETLATIAPGAREHGVPSLDLSLLRERLDGILRRDVGGRMKAFGVRRDRAEVMGLAALILPTLGRYLNVRRMLVPGVGVREGLLQEIAKQAFSQKGRQRYDARSRELLAGVHIFARRMAPLAFDLQHAEHVREMSLLLFDQLQPVHHFPAQARALLEAGALLHDVGHIVSHRGHHKHGEYLVFNGDIAGLEGRERAVVAGLVRYHNRKSDPADHHAAYAVLGNGDQQMVRRLASLVRLAEALDHSHRQHVSNLKASFQRGAVGVQVAAQGDVSEDLHAADRAAALFEKEFRVKLYFRRVSA